MTHVGGSAATKSCHGLQESLRETLRNANTGEQLEDEGDVIGRGVGAWAAHRHPTLHHGGGVWHHPHESRAHRQPLCVKYRRITCVCLLKITAYYELFMQTYTCMHIQICTYVRIYLTMGSIPYCQFRSITKQKTMPFPHYKNPFQMSNSGFKDPMEKTCTPVLENSCCNNFTHQKVTGLNFVWSYFI